MTTSPSQALVNACSLLLIMLTLPHWEALNFVVISCLVVWGWEWLGVLRLAETVGRITKKSFRWRSQRRGVSKESLRRKIIFNDFPSYSYRIHIKRKLTLEIWRKNCYASMVLWRNWTESWLPWFLDFSRALSGQQQNYIFLWHSTTREFWVTLRKRWRITREGQGLSRIEPHRALQNQTLMWLQQRLGDRLASRSDPKWAPHSPEPSYSDFRLQGLSKDCDCPKSSLDNQITERRNNFEDQSHPKRWVGPIINNFTGFSDDCQRQLSDPLAHKLERS